MVNYCASLQLNILFKYMNLTSSLNLASQTALEREELRKLKTILSLLSEQSDASEFLEPVNWEGLELLDYPRIVKKPMDLGTVTTKLSNEQYVWMEEVLDDIQLIWDNCKSYNQNGSWIYLMADRMEKYFRKLVKNYFNSIVIPIQPPKTVPKEEYPEPVRGSLRVNNKRADRQETKIYSEDDPTKTKTDKNKMLEKLKTLNPDELGLAVEIIMREAPEAFELSGDRCTIYVQHIQGWLWKEVSERLSQAREIDQRPSKHIKL